MTSPLEAPGIGRESMRSALTLMTLALATLHCSAPPGQDAPPTRLEASGRILFEDIDECSGVVWSGEAYYVHNDSGDDPVVYRSADPTFPPEKTSSLRLDGAQAIDWEDITLLDGDLVVGDIGDNRREREFLTLYRARYSQHGHEDQLELIDSYPFQYPDAPHDAEALLTIDRKVYLVTKAREEKVTNVYRFDELVGLGNLPIGTYNKPTLIAELDIGEGEQVTAGCYDPRTETIVLLTYTHLLQYPRGAFSGPPQKRTLIAARQCEAVCFHDRQLVITNEQRDIFTIDNFLTRDLATLLPPRGKTILPRLENPATIDRTGDAWQTAGETLALRNAQPGEKVIWARGDNALLIAGTLHLEDEFLPSGPPPQTTKGASQGPQLGSAVLFCFADSAGLTLDGSELFIAVGVTHDRTPTVWSLDLIGATLGFEVVAGAELAMNLGNGGLTFELALPLTPALRALLQDTFYFDLHGVRLRENENVCFSGVDLFTVTRPYTWGTAEAP